MPCLRILINGDFLVNAPNQPNNPCDGYIIIHRDESGDVYALDLGGTNFRVKHVRLSTTKSKIDGEDNVEVSIPREVYTGSGTGLFDFLARATVDFINQMDGGTRSVNTDWWEYMIIWFNP